MQTSLLKHNRRLKQRDSLPLNAAIGSWGIGSPPEAEGCEVGRGVPSPLGSLGEVWGDVPPSQIFFLIFI